MWNQDLSGDLGLRGLDIFDEVAGVSVTKARMEGR